uniref:Outer envelope pore protein 37, chloroplastic-like n=1 Tax=Elaeis guineensis var. tenera TaxID=51953 RepID=A0A6J0PEB0_ELAGV|nr:outer envelope pore protein 37, chloroplastic-like [Elaeis guineensis]
MWNVIHEKLISAPKIFASSIYNSPRTIWQIAYSYSVVVIQEQQGEVAMVARLADPSYKLELSSSVPSVGLPRATIHLPFGEVSLEQKKTEEVEKVLSVNGILKGHILNGVCTALYKNNDLNLRYCYKDEEMSFIHGVSMSSNALSFAFKRRFSPSDKLRLEMKMTKQKQPL